MIHSSLDLQWRQTPLQRDIAGVSLLLSSSGYFNEQEIAVAGELVQLGLSQGTQSDYEFEFCENSEKLMGFGCYGAIPGTQHRFDIYWIAVMQTLRGQGIGTQLLHRMEADIRQQQGEVVYIETSSREIYHSTRTFYVKHGYQIAAIVADFYADHDDKVIFVKRL